MRKKATPVPVTDEFVPSGAAMNQILCSLRAFLSQRATLDATQVSLATS